MKLLGCYALIGLLCLVESHDNKTARFEGKVFVKKTPRYSLYPEDFYQYSKIRNSNPLLKPIKSIPHCDAENNKIHCENHIRYRTIDGTCNNLKYKWWGAQKTPYQRLLKPNYFKTEDKYPKFVPKLQTKTNYPLPNSRLVANRYPHNDITNGLNSWFTVFGQLVAHDVAHTPKSKVDCPCGTLEVECFNIPLSNYTESFLRAIHATPIKAACLPFERSAPASKVFDCDYKRREQYTIGTHWVDLDIIYGATEKQSNKLRVFIGGLLKTDKVPGSEGESLPILDINQCNQPDTNTKGCVFSGDTRVSDFTFLTVAHTLFHRMHNYIARGLQKINPHWRDDRLFNEARRINIAIYQNIVYYEYLPLLLGEKTMRNFGLNTIHTYADFFYDYNPKLFPNNYNEFVTAGFRLHHTVHSHFAKKDKYLKTSKPIFLDKMMANQYEYFYHLSELMRGFFGAETYVASFSISVQLNHKLDLFTEGNRKSSIGAFNIQRGRDHGMPSYCDVRVLAGQYRPKSWSDLKNFSKEAIKRLQENYSHPCDMDLWVGMTAEKPSEDFVLAPTQNWLVAKNFHNLKYGDRFYFENGHDVKARFTLPQLDSIKSMLIADVFCAVIQTKKVPRYGFFEEHTDEEDDVVRKKADFEKTINGHNPKPDNPNLNCSQSKLKLTYWKEFTYSNAYY